MIRTSLRLLRSAKLHILHGNEYQSRPAAVCCMPQRQVNLTAGVYVRQLHDAFCIQAHAAQGPEVLLLGEGPTCWPLCWAGICIQVDAAQGPEVPLLEEHPICWLVCCARMGGMNVCNLLRRCSLPAFVSPSASCRSLSSA